MRNFLKIKAPLKQQKPFILYIIIFTQFACTSTWFAGNAIMESLTKTLGLKIDSIGLVLSSVQLGFITGTLLFGLLMVADRFSPSKIFLLSALLAALANLTLILPSLGPLGLLIARYGTGFFLAGIYPIGMKIAADYYQHSLGKALGFMVGALVLGTAFPFLLHGTNWGHHPEYVIITTSLLTVIGGVLMFMMVPNGPFRVASATLKLGAAPGLFKNSNFKKAAFGYFGHMWELYAFWAFTPVAIGWFNEKTANVISVSWWTGIIIAVGGISCAVGGLLSKRYGSRNLALVALLFSGFCCFLSPLLFSLPYELFLLGLCLWGIAVTADSPQFSSLIAISVTPELKGTALTLSTCIGFSLTIVSIQLLEYLQHKIAINFLFVVLVIGPAIGVWQIIRFKTD